MKNNTILFGIDTFGDVPTDDSGKLMTYGQAIRQVVEEAVLAEKVGIDAIALGEHHRFEYAISSPDTVLAGIATRTSKITLATGVTVLSSDDPVRVFERFSTIDALSNGRAQVILGRGSFTESFPLFGYDLRDYEVLFEEKVQLFAELLKEEPVTWEGTTRAALDKADVFPKTESGHLQTMIGVGGSPQSVIRAAKYDFPLMLAIIGGSPAHARSSNCLSPAASSGLGFQYGRAMACSTAAPMPSCGIPRSRNAMPAPTRCPRSNSACGALPPRQVSSTGMISAIAGAL